jgi:hypothetical protein
MSDAQPQQAQGGQQRQQPVMLRPDDILKLQSLTDDEKQKYRPAIVNFWTMHDQNAPGSTEHTTARQRLIEFSSKFIVRERQYRNKMRLQQQGAEGQPGQASQQSQSQNQGPQLGNAPIKQEQPQSLQRSAEHVGPQQPQQPQQPPQGHSQAQAQLQQAHTAPPPGASRPAAANVSQIEAQIHKHVQDFPIHLPPLGPLPGAPEYESKVKDYRQGYQNLLIKQASVADNSKRLKFQIEERQKGGHDIPQELLAMKQRVDKDHANLKEQVDKFRRMQSQWKQERERQQQAPPGHGQGQGQPGSMDQAQAQHPQHSPQQQPMQLQQPPQRQPQQSNMSMQPQIKEEPQIKVEGGPQPQPQYNMQGQQQPQNMQMPPSLQQQQQQQQQQVRPPPAPHSLSMPPNQAQQFAQPGQQHMQQNMQQNRPQINPHQANAHQHQQSGSPHAQSATSAVPPVPLSHQAAVSAANRSYTDPQRTNTPLQQGGQGNFGSREREQLNNPKMPIPRHLNVTSPAPVHMGQARPTMSGPTNGAPGPMGQPVIPRPPPFQLEGEGDRVLSKRKLDELVRQVTGGSEEALTSEVEEVSDIS